MGFIQKAFLRANNKKILDKLKELGYHICPCCYFDRAVWLDICIPTQSIHGIGYPDECYNLPLEQELKRFLSEKEEKTSGRKSGSGVRETGRNQRSVKSRRI